MNLILHIGAPKTATSALQHAFFPHHPDLYFLGKQVESQRGWTGWRTPEIDSLMLRLERTNFDFQPDRAAIARIVDEVRAAAVGRPVVISSEDLCLFTGIDSFSKIERVRDLFGPLGTIRIILCVREQVSLLKSLYVTEHRGEMLKLAGTQQTWYPSFDQYLDIHFRYAWGAVLESFRFAAMIERYVSMVGADNVFVYSFNEFQRDALNVLRSICRFIGVDEQADCLEKTVTTRENVHYPARVYSFVRLRERLAPLWHAKAIVPARLKDRFHQWLGRGDAFSIMPSDDAVRRITAFYRADNDLLFRSRRIRL